jgi:hypothetical protein
VYSWAREVQSLHFRLIIFLVSSNNQLVIIIVRGAEWLHARPTR